MNLIQITFDHGKSRIAAVDGEILFNDHITDYIRRNDYKLYDPQSTGWFETEGDEKLLFTKKLINTKTENLGILPDTDTPLFAGVTVIISPSRTGKTTYCRSIIDNNDHQDNILQLVTKEDDLDEPYIISSRYELLYRLVEGIRNKRKIITIDSLRFLAFEKSGTTGEKGINMGLFIPLTDLSILARQINTAIVVVVNIMSASKETLNLFIQNLRASVATVLTIDNFKPKVFSRYVETAIYNPHEDTHDYHNFSNLFQIN